MRDVTRRVLVVFLFVFLTSSAVWAQSTAQISGTIKDQTGALLPGVQVTATQTATGLARNALSDETGSYVLTNLPAGPYKLEAALTGFRTYAQTGIVLEVGGSPAINIALEVGQVSETLEVQANAALVETRATGIGQVIDNVRVVELPLNARNVQQLILVSGNAIGGGYFNTNRGYPVDVISVAGGLENGLTYLLDGASHNDPYSSFNFPLPFPDALQEFKVETSSVPAQYGQHSGGAVNAVTKSGTNDIHGTAFEFVRNRVFNARNAFATVRDGLKRNQFGGVLGGPIIKDKLFFFGGDQATIVRSDPGTIINFIPTPQMVTGDFTTIASPACNNGRQITLKAPFVNNRIDPSQFSPVAMNIVAKNPIVNDPCGRIQFSRKNNSTEQLIVGRVDYQQNQKNSLFGRYELARLNTPNDYDGRIWFSLADPDYTRRYHTFAFGDTYLLGSSVVLSFHGAVLRTLNEKQPGAKLFSWADLGVKGLYIDPRYGSIAPLDVSGAFTTGQPGQPALHAAGVTNSTGEQLAEDVSWLHGAHQIGFGVNYLHNSLAQLSGTTAYATFTFGAQNTGLSLGDFMLGKPSTFANSQFVSYYIHKNSTGLYLQDTWKVTSHLTVSPGVRWEPYLPPYKDYPPVPTFNKAWFDQGIHSTVFKNAHAGILFPGDPGVPNTNQLEDRSWMHFAPRLGLAYDPKGDGLMVIRAAYGLFFDYGDLERYGGALNNPPNAFGVSVPNPVGGVDNPYLGYPGGNPFPLTVGPNMPFPQSSYSTFPAGLKKTYINQWNLAIQRQVSDYLLSASYLGNNGIHESIGLQDNLSVYIPGASCVLNGVTYSPCSSTSNTTQRRVLYLQNAAEGQYYTGVTHLSTDATRVFHGMMLSVQKRQSKGVTVLANYTLSHCIDDGLMVNATNVNPIRRWANRGNCELDRRHNFNFSTVYATPQFSNRTVRALGSGWQVSGIVRILSGSYFSVTSGLDNALTGEGNQKPNQVLASPYAPKKSIQSWLNPAAFVQPATGTYGTLGSQNILGPGSINIDMGITRTFKVTERQSVQFRAEAFNLPNHVNPNNPPTASLGGELLTDSNFGKILSAADGRTMQMALKYVF